MLVPSHTGRGLVNLMAELEARLTGWAPAPPLDQGLGGQVPDAETYVLALFDGLGVAQLGHEMAAALAASQAGVMQAPFPTTTSVSLATVATGLAPSQHGQVAHLTWFQDLDLVVNTLKWVSLTGEPVAYDYASVLPPTNLWERLRAAGVEPVTVQPADFEGSPLSRLLYRGARFERVSNLEEMVVATTQLAAQPRRLIFVYLPHVDFAGHTHGLASEEFSDAVSLAAGVWEGITALLPANAALVGTADHGLVEFSEQQKQLIRDPAFDALRFAGDSRGVQLWGEMGMMEKLATLTGGNLVDPTELIGPEPTETAISRLGDMVLLPPDDRVVLPKGFDKRLRCYHGGLSLAEVEIPLLLA